MSLQVNFRAVIKVVSLLVSISGLFILLCVPVSLLTGGKDAIALSISGLLVIAVSGMVWLLTGRINPNELGKHEAYLIVVLSWVMISAFGSLPYIISGAIPSFTNAFFESISGFTTTGATILTDIEAVPKGILFWRSLTHWLGGMGIIMFSIALLPFLGIGGMQLFLAEHPSPSKEKLHPRIKNTAGLLWGVYVLITALQVIFLVAGDMDLYDAVCHSFATISTGGFSTRNASLGAFSPYAQYVTIAFMIIAAASMALHYQLLNGNWREVIRNEELRFYLAIIVVATMALTITLYINTESPFSKSFRDAFFQVTTIITCTGFGTADYMQWPPFAWFLLFMLMFVGGCTGSTAGGIKVLRHLLLIKNSIINFRSIMHPSAYVPLLYNGKAIGDDIRNHIMSLFLIYMITFAAGSLLLALTGLDKTTAMGSAATAMANIGPGLNLTGPASNFFGVSSEAKWILSALMLVGRLELLSVYMLFARSFWKM